MSLHKTRWAQPLLFLLAGLFLASGAMIGWQALYIGKLATPAEIDAYHFGSESMRAHGGPKYDSAQAYVRSEAIWATCLLLAAAAFYYLARRSMRRRVPPSVV